MDYDIFAEYYDLLTEDVDYPNRSEYLLKLFDKFDRRPSLLLDIGCGTGGFSVEFAKRGIEVIGVAPSDNMLNIAAVKAGKHAGCKDRRWGRHSFSQSVGRGTGPLRNS